MLKQTATTAQTSGNFPPTAKPANLVARTKCKGKKGVFVAEQLVALQYTDGRRATQSFSATANNQRGNARAKGFADGRCAGVNIIELKTK